MRSVIRTALFAAFLFAALSLLSFGTSAATVLTQITDTPYLDAGPFWSPDGSRIAIGSERTGSMEIWLIDADGSNPVQLTNSPGAKVGHTWSADGQWIVYAVALGGPEEFYRIPVTGGTPVLITGNSWRDLEPDWAPSGSWVICHAWRNDWDVAVYDGLAGGLVHWGTSHGALDAEPDFSPNLDRIIFRSNRDGGNDIYVAPLPAGNQGTRLTFAPGDDIQPAWSPSHGLIALASDRLWADRPTLPAGPLPLEALMIEQSDIWITDEAGTFVVPVTEDGLFNYAPSWSPDGTRIAFHSYRNGNWDVFIADDLPINTPVEPATWGGMKARFRDE